MKLIVCVDDRMGMMFNKRRQSKDEKVREDILSMLDEGQKLFVSPYTAKQFLPEEQEKVYVSETFLSEATGEDICFIEDSDVSELEDKIESIVLYRWNRHYPSDRYFTLDLSNYELISSFDFVGNSHPEMLKEEYQKKIGLEEKEAYICEETVVENEEELNLEYEKEE